MRKFGIVLFLAVGIMYSLSAQVTITESGSTKTTVEGPVIVAGANHLTTYPVPNIPVPYNTIQASDTFIFKGEVEIVLGPDNILGTNDQFYTQDYMTTSAGYYHAYLVPPSNYAELKPEPDADYVVTVENKIYFRYVEQYDVTALDYKLYDYKRIQKLPSFTLAAPTMGANYYQLDLNNIGLLHNQYYMLEVKNSKGEMGYLRIKYIKAE